MHSLGVNLTQTDLSIFTLSATSAANETLEMNDISTGMDAIQTYKSSAVFKSPLSIFPKKMNPLPLDLALEESLKTVGTLSFQTRQVLRSLFTTCETTSPELLSVALGRLCHLQTIISNVALRYTNLHITLSKLESLRCLLSTQDCWHPGDARKEFQALCSEELLNWARPLGQEVWEDTSISTDSLTGIDTTSMQNMQSSTTYPWNTSQKRHRCSDVNLTIVFRSNSEELSWEEKPTLTAQTISTLSPTSAEKGIYAMKDTLTGMVDIQTSKLSGASRNLLNTSQKRVNLSYTENLLQEAKQTVGEITSATRIVLRNLSLLCSSTSPELVSVLLGKLSNSQTIIFESLMKFTHLHSNLLELENLRLTNGIPSYFDRNDHANAVKAYASSGLRDWVKHAGQDRLAGTGTYRASSTGPDTQPVVNTLSLTTFPWNLSRKRPSKIVGTPQTRGTHSGTCAPRSFTTGQNRLGTFDWNGKHPNIQRTRNLKQVCQYVRKGGDNYEYGEPIGRCAQDSWRDILRNSTTIKEFYHNLQEQQPRALMCNFNSIKSFAHHHFQRDTPIYKSPYDSFKALDDISISMEQSIGIDTTNTLDTQSLTTFPLNTSPKRHRSSDANLNSRPLKSIKR